MIVSLMPFVVYLFEVGMDDVEENTFNGEYLELEAWFHHLNDSTQPFLSIVSIVSSCLIV